MDPETIRELATPLLNALGIGDDPLISPMPGSSLKRTFKLHHEGLDYALKWYPITPPTLRTPLIPNGIFINISKKLKSMKIRLP